MELLSDRLISSPTDLTYFLECEHLTQLERRAAAGEITRPVVEDPEGDVVRRRGMQHERRYLSHLKAQGRQVVEIRSARGDSESRHTEEYRQTLIAMQQGADVIYQATFFGDGWLGHADFLLRVDLASALGAYSYEVADTKLARSVKANALVQMCAYSEQLAGLQHVQPEYMHVVLGDMSIESHRVTNYAAYYRAVKARFLAALGEARSDAYPDPVAHCALCPWATRCEQRRRDDDHLSLVAGLRRDQNRKLAVAGVPTLASLAASDLNSVRGMGEHTFQRLRRQASLQLQQRETDRVHYEILSPEGPGRGLSALPLPSPGDLFFDMEGDPWETDDGLEYLFGVVEVLQGRPQYRAFWAHDPAEEKQAFESFVDFVMNRLVAHPDLHIYHYASYEPDRMKRLMSRYGTRENEVDRLLRGGVFVDLYQIVKQGVRVSQESYSIKKLEPLYMPGRQTAVVGGAASIAFYEQWLESKDGGLLNDISDYNQDDCVSTWLLRDWLEERRLETEAVCGELPRPTPRSMEPAESQQEQEERTVSLLTSLLASVPEDPSQRSDEQTARWLLAQLLGWHRREDRPEWWAYFERLRKTDEDLWNDGDALAGITYEGVAHKVNRSLIHRYSFDPEQEHKILRGDTPHDPRTQKPAGLVVSVNNVDGFIDLQRGANSTAPHPEVLIPAPPINSSVLREGIARVASWVVEHGFSNPGPHQAALDLLQRHPPRLEADSSGEAALRPESMPGEVLYRLDDSYLAIQGPPGSGKTYTAARLILELIRQGKRIGVTAVSHMAIGNLLEELGRAAQEIGVSVRALQKVAEGEQGTTPSVERTLSNAAVDDAVAKNAVDVVAGTPWLFARVELQGQFDALFIDEAGQLSLANVLAMSGTARNLVVLGDPQQLPQVTKGVHPRGAEKSALAHLLGGNDTMPPHLGIFLGTTWRLHPDVCRFVSEVSYDNRLEAHPSCARQFLDGSIPTLNSSGSISGLRYLPVEHQGNRSWSAEEVSKVDALVSELMGAAWTSTNGERRAMTLADVLVVAPYNAHVARLAQSLARGSRVGTVDRFQGQEAPVVVYSLATSSADDLPRNLEFLYSPNRLNVAVSRARALAILICSPALLAVRCRTPNQMRLANAFCRFAELGTGAALG